MAIATLPGGDSAEVMYGRQQRAVRSAPARFFVPPYVGTTGWVGAWLDDACDWRELGDILRDAYRLAAPKRLAQSLDPTVPQGDRDREGRKARKARVP